MARAFRSLAMFAVLPICLLAVRAGDRPQTPQTAKKPVTDEYHGVKVIDNYRWLDNAEAPEVKKWTEAQNRHTRAVLDQFAGMKALRQRIQKLVDASSSD